MPTPMSCSKGHEWQADLPVDASESRLGQSCPVCGSEARVATPRSLSGDTALPSTASLPAASPAASSAPPPAASEPRYQALKLHAKGGLGEVHLARDTELGRAVALKRIQDRHAGDAESLRRFRVEAEITARLEHPGIVPIYGLVHDEAGQPSYAMRFIQGESLAEAIRRLHETQVDFGGVAFRQLVQRFVTVCNTVAYAHSRGVLHRDLKPANVMLGPYGETLVVDWGLAKDLGKKPARSATEPAARAATPPAPAGQDETLDATTDYPGKNTAGHATRLGAALGTPAYMSPEQAAGRWDVIEPASDVYSLGATLYELLTGDSPVSGGDIFEARHKALHGDFLRPRQINPSVPKPLEAVCLKAMAAKPEQRYPGALDLAADLERWLADEPVSVFPDPPAVRARRWARRHPGVVAGVVAAVLVGVAAMALGAVLLGQKNEALVKKNSDLEAATREANARRDESQKRLGVVEKANDVLLSVLVDLDPRAEEIEGKPLRAILGKRLDTAAAALEGEALGDPLVVAKLQTELGVTQTNLGHPEKAVELLRKAVETRKAKLGPVHSDTLNSMHYLATAYRHEGRLGLAVPLFEETLKLRKATVGPEHPDTLHTMNSLAVAYQVAEKLDLALPLFEETLKLRRAVRGPEHSDTLATMNNLATVYHLVGKPSLAVPLFEESFELLKATDGPEHPNTLAVMHNLAAAYLAAGRVDLAVPLFQDTLKLRKARLSAEHPSTQATMYLLAEAYRLSGQLNLAVPLHEETLKLRKATRGAKHPDTLNSMNALASAYQADGKPDLALPLLEEVLEQRKATWGAEDPRTLAVMNNFAKAYDAAGRLDLALPLLQQAAEGMENRRFAHQHAGGIVANLIDCYERHEQLDRAEVWRRKWTAVIRDRAGAQSTSYATELAGLGKNLLLQGKFTDAELALRESLAIREKDEPERWPTFNTKSTLGDALAGQQRYSEAEPLLLEGYEGLKKREAQIPEGTRALRLSEAIDRLVRLYDAWGKPEQAAEWRKKLPSKPEAGGP